MRAVEKSKCLPNDDDAVWKGGPVTNVTGHMWPLKIGEGVHVSIILKRLARDDSSTNFWL